MKILNKLEQGQKYLLGDTGNKVVTKEILSFDNFVGFSTFELPHLGLDLPKLTVSAVAWKKGKINKINNIIAFSAPEKDPWVVLQIVDQVNLVQVFTALYYRIKNQESESIFCTCELVRFLSDLAGCFAEPEELVKSATSWERQNYEKAAKTDHCLISK